MQGLKTVRSRLVLSNTRGTLPEYIDVTSTFNMTERMYLDRDPDMQVELATGERMRIIKSLIISIKEVRVVEQVAEEVKE